MTIGWLAASALLAVGCGTCQDSRPVVRVCLHSGPEVSQVAVKRAESIATGILDEAGVRTEWLNGKCRPERDGAGRDPSAVETLEIEVDGSENPKYGAGDALAYASPYQSYGVRIQLFFGRILNRYGSKAALVLGHVLAHEIGHVLEGVARHSSQGVLKISFATRDVELMAAGRLQFAPEDVHIIRARFKSLSSRSGVSIN